MPRRDAEHAAAGHAGRWLRDYRTNIWHASLPSRGTRERETVFLRYFSTERAARSFAMPAELTEGAEKLGRLTPRTRLLLGLEDG